MIPWLSGCRKVGWWYWTDYQLGYAVGQGRIAVNALQHYQGQRGILSAKFLDFILFTVAFTGMTMLSPQHHWQTTISVSGLYATQIRNFPSFFEKSYDDLKKKEISTLCESLALTLLLVLSLFLPKKTNSRLIWTAAMLIPPPYLSTISTTPLPASTPPFST